MKYSTGLLGALSAGLVASVPLESRQTGNIDVTVLQFALTLEHLENKFYSDALKKFSEGDFAAAGYGATYYEDLKYIASDESSHVALLSSALSAAGQTPVQPCTYSFPYTDVKSFISLSSIIEGVGTSAYLGGAPLITSKDYLTVAGSILVTEALHTSYQRAAVAEVPFASPYGTPLDPTSVYTLAAAFITSCPATNPPLPFTPLPGLTYNATQSCAVPKIRKRSITCRAPKPKPSGTEGGYPSGTATATPIPTPTGNSTMNPVTCEKFAGDSIVLTAAGNGTLPATTYATFVSGLNVASVQAASVVGQSVTVAIPAAAMGQTYVFLTSAAAAGKLDSTTIIAGPAIVEVAPPPPVYDVNVKREIE
ncbi:Protein rds1 [Cyphellophora attinorum]|uniref:Protein rds1 n=1 Tax=Cyphellophora attinorum TaxID=1664694 RepID=A0A0N0NMI5_9EURO|nr:Protein rds1 [Phialophora attinorum]KPI40501.1 Protein rds1 [Phialophora attinorum]